MNGKYSSWPRYTLAKTRRAVLRLLLARTVRWKKADFKDGYTIIIGAIANLPALLVANITLLSQQDLAGARELILVFDLEPAGGIEGLDQNISDLKLPIPHRIICWQKKQKRVADLIHWPWVNNWISWGIGIGEATTQHAVLHDLDAMLLKRNYLKERYERLREQDCHYLGVHWDRGNGLEKSDKIVPTLELFFNLQHIRHHFRPIDLFNHIAIFNGKSVDFDLTRYVQSLGTRQILESLETEMVHPSQLLCQYGYWQLDDPRLDRQRNSLAILLYFLWLGGETEPLNEATSALNQRPFKQVLFRGKALPIDALLPEHVAWIIKQTTQLEKGIAGQTRPEVQKYIDALNFWSNSRNKTSKVATELMPA